MKEKMPQEESKSKPEKLISVHLGGEIPKIEKAREKRVSPQELYGLRQEALDKAPDLPADIRLNAVEEFQRLAKEAQDLRNVVREAKDQKEKDLALKLYSEKKKNIEGFLKDGGLSLEKAYREYIQSEKDYFKFIRINERAQKLEALLQEPSFKSIPESKKFDEKAYARIESVTRSAEASVKKDQKEDIEQALTALKTIYSEDSKEYKEAEKRLLAKEKTLIPQTKKEVSKEVKELQKKAERMWDDPMIRYFAGKNEIEKILQEFAEGKDVTETQRVIELLNKIHDWETLHQNTTVGGVFVGPPGVGKTTLARHYLEQKERNYNYIDLSEDVTRYMLYGSKSIDFKSPSEYFERLSKDLSDLGEDEFKKFVLENSKALKDILGLQGEEATVVFLDQLREDFERGKDLSDKALSEKMEQVHVKVNNLAKQAFRKELAEEFARIVKKNGWRDGVIISALRNDQSIILDEFNKNKNWSLIYGLITAKPGEKWYFADNKEWIKVPENWRMYFTTNIGRKHGGFKIAEALASRAGGKVMEINYPSSKEEMQIALSSLSNPEGDFLYSKSDLAKLYVLVNEGFPGIRKFIEDKDQSIPVSFRTIRDIGEKLVLSRDPKTKRPVYSPTDTTFDRAVYDVMVESYNLYEDKTIPKEIVNLLTSVGILLDDSVKKDVLKWIDEKTYKDRKKQFKEQKEDYEAIVEKIRGLGREDVLHTMPIQKKF